MELNLKEKLVESLLGIYQLDFVGELSYFLQGESSVLLSLSLGKEFKVKEVSENANVSKSRMTAIISSLRRKGLITIKRDEVDKRSKYLKITKKGSELINLRKQKADAIISENIAKLGDEDTKKLISVLDNFVRKVNS